MSTPSAPAAASASKPLDEFGKMAIERYVDTVNQFNALSAQVKAATGDPQALLDTLRETYRDDPNVAKISDAIDDLDNKREALWAKRDEILKPIVAERVEQAKSGLGDSEAVAKELLKTVKQAANYITSMYGEAVLEGTPPVKTVRASSGGTDGRSGSRVRGFDVFIGGNLVQQEVKSKDKQGNPVTKMTSNLAVAGKTIGVETSVLREQFQAAAGTTDSDKYPATVNFQIAVGEGDARKVHDIKCVKTSSDESGASNTAPAADAAPAAE